MILILIASFIIKITLPYGNHYVIMGSLVLQGRLVLLDQLVLMVEYQGLQVQQEVLE